jgi:hypothetical protein
MAKKTNVRKRGNKGEQAQSSGAQRPDDALEADDLEQVAGGFNPQPDPPGRLQKGLPMEKFFQGWVALDPPMKKGG